MVQSWLSGGGGGGGGGDSSNKGGGGQGGYQSVPTGVEVGHDTGWWWFWWYSWFSGGNGSNATSCGTHSNDRRSGGSGGGGGMMVVVVVLLAFSGYCCGGGGGGGETLRLRKSVSNFPTRSTVTNISSNYTNTSSGTVEVKLYRALVQHKVLGSDNKLTLTAW